MRIVAVSCVKNEGDIIEAFVRHTLVHVDRLVILDQASVDATRTILGALQAEGLPLDVVDEPSLGKQLQRHMNRLIRERAIPVHRADWIVPLDADEFVTVPDDGFLIPADASQDQPIALPWRTYVPTPDDDPAQVNPVARLRCRLASEGWRVDKVMAPAALFRRAEVVLKAGSHAILVADEPMPARDGAPRCLGHFPIRSPQQHLAKIVVNELQYRTLPERPQNYGAHYHQFYEVLRRDPRAFAAGFYDAARQSPMRPARQEPYTTVADPLAYRGGPLRHTGTPDQDSGWAVVLAYAEQLAHHCSLLAKTSNAAERDDDLVIDLAKRNREQEERLLQQYQQLLQKEYVLQEQHRQLQEMQQQERTRRQVRVQALEQLLARRSTLRARLARGLRALGLGGRRRKPQTPSP